MGSHSAGKGVPIRFRMPILDAWRVPHAFECKQGSKFALRLCVTAGAARDLKMGMFLGWLKEFAARGDGWADRKPLSHHDLLEWGVSRLLGACEGYRLRVCDKVLSHILYCHARIACLGRIQS